MTEVAPPYGDGLPLAVYAAMFAEPPVIHVFHCFSAGEYQCAVEKDAMGRLHIGVSRRLFESIQKHLRVCAGRDITTMDVRHVPVSFTRIKLPPPNVWGLTDPWPDQYLAPLPIVPPT